LHEFLLVFGFQPIKDWIFQLEDLPAAVGAPTETFEQQMEKGYVLEQALLPAFAECPITSCFLSRSLASPGALGNPPGGAACDSQDRGFLD